MKIRLFFVLSILLTALALGGGLAHLYALPNKMHLSREQYLVAQQDQATVNWTILPDNWE